MKLTFLHPTLCSGFNMIKKLAPAILLALIASFLPSPASQAEEPVTSSKMVFQEAVIDPCDAIAQWNYEPGAEYPGAQGGISSGEEKDSGKFLRLDYDFSDGGLYVTANRPVNIGRTTSEISFLVRQQGTNEGFLRITDATGQTHQGTFQAPDGTWQKVVIPLSAKQFNGSHWGGANDGKFYFPLSLIQIGVNHTPNKVGNLWIRNLSARTTDAAQFQTLNLITPWPGNIAFKEQKSSPVTLVLTNALDVSAKLKLCFQIEDWYGTKRVIPDESTEVPPRGQFRKELTLDLNRSNYYLIRAEILHEGKSVLKDWKAVTVVEQPLNFGKDDLTSFFGLQSNNGSERTERLGVKWLRVNSGISLASIRKSHQLIMNTLTYFTEPGKLDSKVIENEVKKNAEFVHTFEIQNEPYYTNMINPGRDLKSAVDLFLGILNKAVPVVRRLAPGKPVASNHLMDETDKGWFKFSEAVMAEGASKLIDIYTPHTYADSRYFGTDQNPLWPVPGNERKRLERMFTLLKEHGATGQIWVGEKGWAADRTQDALSIHARNMARCLIQSMVIAHSVPGVERYFWFTEEGTVEGVYDYGLFQNRQPVPAALAYATLAQQLYHVRPFRSWDRKDFLQAHCFVSKESDTGILVLWSEDTQLKNPSQFSLKKMPTEWAALDMIGNPLTAGAKGSELRLALDRSPVFVRFPAKNIEGLCAALEAAVLNCEDPLQIETAYFSDLSHLNVRIHNKTSPKISGQVKSGTQAQDITLEGGESLVASLPAPVDLLALAQKEVPVVVNVAERSVTFNAPARILPCPQLQGLPASSLPIPWDSSPDFILDQRTQILPSDSGIGWDGLEDLSAKAWLGWSEKGLYLNVKVRDDSHVVDQAELVNFWNSDSLQIAIDSQNDAAPSAGYDQNDVEIGLVLAKDEPHVYQTAPMAKSLELPCSIVRDEDKKDTLYQVLIPWSLLGRTPKEGQVFGFNFVINENDGKGRSIWMGLTPGISERKNPWGYKKLYLAPSVKPN
jgi:hypothetical protein